MTMTIIFIIIGMLWSYYQKFTKEQEQQQALQQLEAQSRQSAGISEGVSVADPYGTPQGRTDGISEGQTQEWQDVRDEVVEQKPEPTAQSVTPKQNLFTKQNLTQAILLSEILSEPRSKRPWKPNRHR